MKLRVSIALFALFALVTSLCHAQMSEGERKAAARAAYGEGVELQEKGKPAEALARFEAAQKLYDAPTHLLRIAECQTVTGKLVEASETYETLSRKTLPAGSPDAFVHAQEKGKTALTELRKRIPSLRVTVKPEPHTLQNLQIIVNDKQMPNELVGIARPVNPGPYKVTAYATGYGTPSPVTLDIGESEQKTADLTLQQGVTGAAPVVVGSVASSTTLPPPYEQPKPTKPVDGPSATGVLFGVRGGVLVPTGDVDKTTKFADYASAGGSIGADVMGRFAKIFLLGASLEFASFGGPKPSALPAGSSAQISTSSLYYGILAGIIPNVDKLTFIADAGVGVRELNQSRLVTALGVVGPRTSDEKYSGVEIALNAGVSFPVGPIRIVPKAGFAFGQFGDRQCSGFVANRPGCDTINSSGHTMFNVVLAVYYHLDLSKKRPPPPPAAQAPTAPSLSTGL